MTVTKRKRVHSRHQPVGRWIRPTKRLAIYLRDGFRCLLCDADLTTATPRGITLEHRVARSDGGSNDESNLHTCCRACNDAHVKPSGRTAENIAAICARSLARYLRMAKMTSNYHG